jgi:hypothetical protein
LAFAIASIQRIYQLPKETSILAIADEVFADLNAVNEVYQSFIPNNRYSTLEFFNLTGKLAGDTRVLPKPA